MKRTTIVRALMACAALATTGCAAEVEGSDAPIEHIELGLQTQADVRLPAEKTFKVFDADGYSRQITIASSTVMDSPRELRYLVAIEGVEGFRLLSITSELGSLVIRVMDMNGKVVGLATATHNFGVRLFSSNGAECERGALGPFVYEPTTPCPVDLINDEAYPEYVMTLLDQQVLSKLYRPTRLNLGTISADEMTLVDAVYAQLYSTHKRLWDSFRFRPKVAWVNDSDVVSAIQSGMDDLGLPHMHHDINHWDALGDSDEDYTDLDVDAGFLDGHRAYMRLLESWFASHSSQVAGVLPFRRLPAWNTNSNVPTAFRGVTGDFAQFIAPGAIPSAIRVNTICNTYATSRTPRLTAMVSLGDIASAHSVTSDGRNFNGWHGTVHTDLAGRFGALATAAEVPFFFVWHTTVDVVWANLQQCYLND